MAIEFVCPACNNTLQVGDETAGRVIRCGGCMTALKVPDDGARRAAPPDPYEVDRPAAPPPPPRVPSPPAEPRPDEDDRYARPRRRRPPPPPPGRGVFFWLVIAGAVMIVGTLVCCGGALLLVSGAEWQTHESKDGGFRVEMPNRPQPDVARSAKINLKDKDTKSEGTVLLKRGAAQFIVFYRNVPAEKERLAKRPADTDERVIDREVQRLLAAMQDEKQRAEKPAAGRAAPHLGFTGREVDFRARSGFYTARVIVADERVYTLLGGGGVTEWGDADVRQFLDSFELTRPELKAEGQRRADAAKEKEKAEKERGEREDRRKAGAEADETREAAAEVGAAAVGAGLREARPVPRLPVAPPPRPVEDD